MLQRATGEFIAFFDDDDISKPNRISERLNLIRNFEEKFQTQNVACYASTCRHYQNSYETSSPAIGSDWRSPPRGDEVAVYLLAYVKNNRKFYGSGTPTSSLIIKSKLLRHIGGFDPKLRRVEDVDLAVRLALEAVTLSAIRLS